MAFPDDLADVAVFKIHPAIGCARLANNDDFYEFFDYEEKRKAGQAQSLSYMTMRNGKHWIMRQAVRFRIFAYRSDGGEIGELTEEIMDRLGLCATWTASVANRKLNVWSGGATPAVAAQASATASETKRLEGDNPWRQGRHASEVLRLASAIPRPQARAIRAAMFRSTGMRCHQSSR